jgi:DNA-binding transcriptional regulator GbsR (MarR family)
MPDILDGVKGELTREFTGMTDMYGISPALMKAYMELFFTLEPLGLSELSERTGYSVSRISQTMHVAENLLDVRRLQRPGSKKIYYECTHDIKLIQKKKIEKSMKQMESIIASLETQIGRLESSKDENAQVIKSHLKELLGFYRKATGMLPKLCLKLMEFKND